MWRIRRRPRERPLPFQYVFIISFIIFILLTAQALWLVDKGLQPTLMEIAENETKKYAQLAIQSAIKKRIVESDSIENIIDVTRDNNGKVSSVNTNPKVANEILQLATTNVQFYLEQIEAGNVPDHAEFSDVEVKRESEGNRGIFTEIPMGRATHNTLLANLGPKIPVGFRLTGAVETDVKEELIQSGINNQVYKVWISVIVDVQIVVPFETKKSRIVTNIPLVNMFINGEVPDYYNNGGNGTLQPTLPIEKKENESNN
ncbi:sporulation protein YunB [Pseudalkalibacillus sp. A8]|uniref:sporulation protein YunB n=1 Tax=Pseudalkalibacillus sp. A8 TaxID=3382641 RepID=UPI0038B60BBE